MIVKQFFKEKYLGYELILYENDENADSIHYDLNFFIRKNKVTYCGLFTKQERDSIDEFIESNKERTVDDYDIDKEYKQVFIYLT